MKDFDLVDVVFYAVFRTVCLVRDHRLRLVTNHGKIEAFCLRCMKDIPYTFVDVDVAMSGQGTDWHDAQGVESPQDVQP